MTNKYKTERTSRIACGRKDSATGYNPIKRSNTRRQATRCKARGIVILTDYKIPLVANIYDISTRGISFWPTDQEKLTRKEFNMDILIFDAQTSFEYFISQVQGRVRYTKKLIRNPITNALVRRFGLKFIHLNSARHTILETCCSMLFNQRRVFRQML